MMNILIKMTDNYQFDKNSKLFQKFLTLKANKNNESVVEKQHPLGPPDQNVQKNLSMPYRLPEKNGKKDRSGSIEPHANTLTGPLHVTIDDIEEAASEALNDSTLNRSQYPQKEDFSEAPEVRIDANQIEREREVTMTKKQTVMETEVQNVMPKNDRNRERRTREFRQRPRAREEKVDEDIMQRQEPSISPKARGGFNMSFKPAQVQIEHQFQNIEQNFKEEPSFKPEENFTLGSKQGQYRKKYEKANQKYEQMKQILQQERKQNQLFKNEKEAEVEILKQKYFELRSIEDTLTTDLKRCKDRLQSENMMRTKFEEEVKELNFRIIELEEILEGKEANLKKKNDEITYWKTQNEQIRTQLKEYYAEVETYEQKYKFLESQSKIVHKDVSHKEQLVDELRKNIATLIEENNIAKDQLYKLTIKLYHLEQENMSLRADVLRRENEQPHNISAIQNNYLRSIEISSPKKGKERPQRHQNVTENNEPREQGHRRKRQFARERAITKPEQAQRAPERQQRRERRTNYPQRHQGNLDNNVREGRQIAARIQYLQNELESRSKQRAMNGRMRKQKIEMQRELETLIQKQIQ